LNLSSSIGINIKLYLQNLFIRAIFYIDQNKYPDLKARINFLDVEVIGEAVFYFPYLIISLTLIIGIIVFIFINIDKYGLIVLGTFLFFITTIILFGIYAYRLMR